MLLWLLFQTTRVQFQAPTWQLTTTVKYRPRGSDAGPLKMCIHIHVGKILMIIK